MMLRLGGAAVPMESVIAVLNLEAASNSETAAFFRSAAGEKRAVDTSGSPRRSVVLTHKDGTDTLYYSSVNAHTLRRRVNGATRCNRVTGGGDEVAGANDCV